MIPAYVGFSTKQENILTLFPGFMFRTNRFQLYLLLCENQRLQVFNNDALEVFHSLFLLSQRGRTTVSEGKTRAVAIFAWRRPHLEPGHFLTDGLGDLVKVSLPLVHLVLQLEHTHTHNQKPPVTPSFLAVHF